MRSTPQRPFQRPFGPSIQCSHGGGVATALHSHPNPSQVVQDERKVAAVQFLREIKPPRDDLYLPTNPHARVLDIVPEGAAPMQVGLGVYVMVM